MAKASTRRLEAAFAELELCVLVELGIHNPLAAEVSIKGECEWGLTARLLENLPYTPFGSWIVGVDEGSISPKSGKLADEKKYPGMELLKLYGFRWEHEIFYKELKINMRGGDVLQSHTPETAAQEVAALLMACALIAEQRLEAARSGEVNPLSISFSKTLEQMNAF